MADGLRKADSCPGGQWVESHARLPARRGAPQHGASPLLQSASPLETHQRTHRRGRLAYGTQHPLGTRSSGCAFVRRASATYHARSSAWVRGAQFSRPLARVVTGKSNLRDPTAGSGEPRGQRSREQRQRTIPSSRLSCISTPSYGPASLSFSSLMITGSPTSGRADKPLAEIQPRHEVLFLYFSSGSGFATVPREAVRARRRSVACPIQRPCFRQGDGTVAARCNVRRSCTREQSLTERARSLLVRALALSVTGTPSSTTAPRACGSRWPQAAHAGAKLR